MAQVSFAQEETDEKKKTQVFIEHYDKISYNRNIGDFQRLIGNVKIRHDSAYFFATVPISMKKPTALTLIKMCISL